MIVYIFLVFLGLCVWRIGLWKNNLTHIFHFVYIDFEIHFDFHLVQFHEQLCTTGVRQCVHAYVSVSVSVNLNFYEENYHVYDFSILSDIVDWW